MKNLRLRYRDALEKLWNCDEAGLEEQERSGVKPGLDPKSRFDFPNGIRMCISREKVPEGIWIHVSCSVFPGTILGQKMAMLMADRKKPELLDREFRKYCKRAYRQLTGDATGMELVDAGEAGIPHWIIWQKRFETTVDPSID